jgi:hypothetical protein
MYKVFHFLTCLNLMFALGQTTEQLNAMPQDMRDYLEMLRSRESEPAKTLAQQLNDMPEEMRVLLADEMFLLETPQSVQGVLFAAKGDIGIMTKSVSPFLGEVLAALDRTKVRVRVLSETLFVLEGVETKTRAFTGLETLVFVNDEFMLVGGFLDGEGSTVWLNQQAPGLESAGTFDLVWSN